MVLWVICLLHSTLAMVSGLCRQPRSWNFLMSVPLNVVLWLRPAVGVLRFPMSCKAVNGQITLLPYFRKESTDRFLDNHPNFTFVNKLNTLKIWKKFHRKLPNYCRTKRHRPKVETLGWCIFRTTIWALTYYVTPASNILRNTQNDHGPRNYLSKIRADYHSDLDNNGIGTRIDFLLRQLGQLQFYRTWDVKLVTCKSTALFDAADLFWHTFCSSVHNDLTH